MSIVDRVDKALRQSLPEQPSDGELSRGRRLIVAVSGGPDSLCLLHILCTGDLYPKEELTVAYLNHGLRKSAGAEAAFVRDFAAGHQVPCIVEERDVATMAQREGLSVEEAGRQARYQFLSDVARENDAHYVLTGHNADDQVETIVMHLLRGSAMTGLRGMQISAPVPGSADLTLIRPLLQVTRQEIDDYCFHYQLTPVIDASNQDATFYRNRLRHELIPLLDEYNPGVRQRLRDMALIMNDEERLLEELVDREWERLLLAAGRGWIKLDRSGWQSTPIALQRRLVRKVILSLLPNLRNMGYRTTEQARVVACRSDIGSISMLPAGVSLSIDYDHLFFSTADAAVSELNPPQLTEEGEINLPVPGHLCLENGWTIQAQILDGLELQSVLENQDPWQAFVSVADLAGLIVRVRRPGEQFRPLGMAGKSAKVSRVMIDRKIPERFRARWPIVADQKHLLWLVGHHIDERVKIGKEGQNVLFLRAYNEVDA